MKYILKEKYALRGFNNGEQPVLLNLETGVGLTLESEMASVLRMCDGSVDLDAFSIIPALNQLAQKAMEIGWVAPAENNQRLMPEQEYKIVKVPNIGSVQWSITGSCNAKCRHCFITASQHTHQDLSTEEMIRIINTLADNNIYDVSITGGEPLIRPDLPILLDEMQKRNVKVTGISTNGFMLNDQMIELFIQHNMRPGVQLSYDGVGHHDWMRGIKGAEEMTIAAMDVCHKYDIPCVVSMCVHQENLHLIVPTIMLAAEHYVKRIRIGLVGDVGGYSDNEGMTLLSMQDAIPYYLDAIPEIIENSPDITIEFSSILSFKGNEPENYQIIPLIHNCTDQKCNRVCKTVENSMYITDDGRLLPCIMVAGSSMENDFLKMTEYSYEECVDAPVYKEFLSLRADTLIKHNPKCQSCEYLARCGCGCRANSINKSGNLYGIDKARCDFFKNNWEEKIRKVMGNSLSIIE